MIQSMRPTGPTRIAAFTLLALFAIFMLGESFAGECAIGSAVPAALAPSFPAQTP
jgi:hypothetical protein